MTMRERFLPTRVDFEKEESGERFLTAAETSRFLDAATLEGDPVCGLLELALYTGARRSNLQAMKWADIDLEERLWRITSADAKANESIRIPLAPEAIATLGRLKKLSKESPYVFPARRKDSKTPHLANPSKQLERVLDRAEIKDFTFHDLRRSAGSRLAANGVPLLTIGKLLGHRSIASTQIYAKLDVSDLRAALEQSVRGMNGG